MAQLAHLAVHLLELLFFVGLAGASGVILISFAEDLRELFGSDEHV